MIEPETQDPQQQLQLQQQQLHDQLFGSGGPYELIDYPARGTTFPFFKDAPPNLRELYRSLQAHGEQTFYVFQDERYSFAETWRQAARVAGALTAMGVRHGDRVGIVMRNYPEWIFSFLGITAIGAVVVALNAWWTREELSYGIDDSGLKILLVDHERLMRVDPRHADIAVVAARTSADELARAPVESRSWAEFLGREDRAMPAPAVRLEDPATLLYTSGSTARPKGVLSTHRAVIAAVLGFEASGALITAMNALAQPDAPADQSPYQEAMILTVPLFHTTGLVPQFLCSLRPGRKLVGMYKWDVDTALRIVERERITQFSGVPTMAWEMVQSPNFDNYDVSSLKFMSGGGAAMAPEQSRQIDQKLENGIARAGYGMTETNALAAAISGEMLTARPTSCGRPLPPLVTVKIADANGNELPRGQTGELWIKGAMVFSEYWNDPESTAQTLTDGWVHSGDIGHMDDEDFIYITDREKDLVIRGGENIGCQEVEAAIWEHPSVSEVAVFGVPDERLGERLAAVIMLKPDKSATADDIKRHVARLLAKFKVPELIWFRKEQLPRVASGKIYKRGLRDEAIRELTASS